MLIVEFLMINYYFSLPDNITIMKEKESSLMVDMMHSKIKYFVSFFDACVTHTKQQLLGKYIQLV